ncbi:MAG: hypothetical protein HWQ43_12365 [Nostoc sp. JL31]|uniref:hypothetical protein n=1 Tax=Nostoc sp. JL31 TaxID=2815395 RepID=UPI0025DD3AB2|nr:hypothetical protein [Nostoc sp. JL31]MBN3889930.1 hypothetical protein [Nostoc sp. JL31]
MLRLQFNWVHLGAIFGQKKDVVLLVVPSVAHLQAVVTLVSVAQSILHDQVSDITYANGLFHRQQPTPWADQIRNQSALAQPTLYLFGFHPY